MSQLKKVKMKQTSLVSLIAKYEGRADWENHDLSNSHGITYGYTDKELLEFLQRIEAGEPVAAITIDNAEWEEYGNCAGDELYPVELWAERFPVGNRYYITINGKDFFDEYVYEVQGGKNE